MNNKRICLYRKAEDTKVDEIFRKEGDTAETTRERLYKSKTPWTFKVHGVFDGIYRVWNFSPVSCSSLYSSRGRMLG